MNGELRLKTETVLPSLEEDLCRIGRRIDKEKNPVMRAKMVSVYRKLSRMLTGKEL